MILWRKELIAQKLLLRGKIKKVLSRAHVCSMEQKATNAHDQHEHTLCNMIILLNYIDYFTLVVDI